MHKYQLLGTLQATCTHLVDYLLQRCYNVHGAMLLLHVCISRYLLLSGI